MVKVSIVSGFLGAGKTTFIKKLVTESFQNEKVVIIENEYGDVNIDSKFLKGTNIAVRELTSGCICCSVANEFKDALTAIVEWGGVDRIIIEPSGVARLSDTLKSIGELTAKDARIKLESVTTVVDAVKCEKYLENFSVFYKDQIAAGKSIALSRTNHISYEKLTSCIKLIRDMNKDAELIVEPWDTISANEILERIATADTLSAVADKKQDRPKLQRGASTGKARYIRAEDMLHGDAKKQFSSWSKETERMFTREEIENALKALDNGEGGMVLRAKGYLKGEEGKSLSFDYVPEESEIRLDTYEEIGRLCVIGIDLDETVLNSVFGA